jgi:hypothetical protein
MEITDLTDDLSEGVQSAGNVVKQVDQTLSGARQQAKQVRLNTRSIVTGLRAAWKTFTAPEATAQRPGELPTKRVPPPLPEQINGTHFIATPNEVIEDEERYPREELPPSPFPSRVAQSPAHQKPVSHDRD